MVRPHLAFVLAAAFLVLSVPSLVHAQPVADPAPPATVNPPAAVNPATDAALATAERHSAIDPQPRPGNWMPRHTRINERIQQGNVDLIFVGDSITEGWAGNGREVWEKYYTHRNAANLGIGGDRTQHVLWRLQNGNIEGIAPKLAVVMIGTNNAGSNTSEEIAEGVTAIVQRLRTDLPAAKVLLLAIFPRGENNEDMRRVVNQGANEIISRLADGENVFYQDIGGVFVEADGTLTRDVMPDLLHLNAASYAKWAAAIEPEVSRLMGDEPVAAPVQSPPAAD